MANTTVKIARDYPASLTAKLVSAGGTGTPNASGYACSASVGMQTFTVAEALVGLFYVYLYDSSDEVAWQGYVLLKDDTNTYYASSDIPALFHLQAIGLDWLFAKAWDQANPVSPAVADSIIMQLFEPDIQPIQFGAGVLTHVPTTINLDATQTTARTNAATAATQATAAAASAASADSKATSIKAKTDLIGTIRSLIRW